MKTSRISTGALAGVLALTLAACGDSGGDAPTSPAEETTAADETTTDETTTDDTGTGDTAGTAEDQLAMLEVVFGAAEDEAGGTAYELDDQDDDGSREVDVAVGDTTSIEVDVSPEGEILGTDSDDLDSDDRDALAAATITILDAARTALGEVDGTIDDIDLDDENGTFAWEVTIDTADEDDIEVYVDVATGDVIKVDRD